MMDKERERSADSIGEKCRIYAARWRYHRGEV